MNREKTDFTVLSYCGPWDFFVFLGGGKHHAHEHTRARGGRTFVQTGTYLLLAHTASYFEPHSMPLEVELTLRKAPD